MTVCALAAAWGLVLGCERGVRDGSRSPSAAVAPAPASGSTSPRAPSSATRPRIVALGDSLTAGYGLLDVQAYPALLQQKLDENGYDFEIVNAGVSGDTSAAGLQRLDWALDGDVRILILELGANDGLRGLPVDQLKQNLGAIIERAQRRHIAVLLTGMEAPPNYGQEYASHFRQVYPALARQYHVTLMPFLLAQVAGIDGLNQADGIHPNPRGATIVADNVWSVLEPMVDAASRS